VQQLETGLSAVGPGTGGPQRATFQSLRKGEPFSISVKLPYSGEEERKLPFAKPTGYGLGKSGWVTLEPEEPDMPSIRQFRSWLEESYRAQAPRRLPPARRSSLPS
jgi:hypothetical protein